MKKYSFAVWAGCALLTQGVFAAGIMRAGGMVYDPPRAEGKYILTPAASEQAQIHGPAVFGVRPGSPFLYAIPATGAEPVRYAVEQLPDGLVVDAKTGVISGTIRSSEKREYATVLIAKNATGTARKSFTIKVGDEICLTPPLGWNSWNCWGTEVSQERVLESARAMVAKGLGKYGWSYINIDDAWQGKRGGSFNAIQSNPATFPDMAAMCDQIHGLGLKVGIYSTPWVTSYAGFVGGSSANASGAWSYEKMSSDTWSIRDDFWFVGEHTFDEVDAAQWAAWGIDYLKYDWFPNDLESTKRMAQALKKSGRDIVFSTSNTCPVHLASRIGTIANCIRTSGDLKDRWDQDGSHLNIREQWVLHKAWIEAGFAGGPGHYPDPDMLVVGHVSTAGKDGEPKPSRLTADEQYSHISLWSLWSAPLLIGAPINMLDDFTLNLLTNSEVLDLQQDANARPARSVLCSPDFEVMVKDLADGSIAVGLFNLKEEDAVLTFDWDMAGVKGPRKIRDVWRHKDIGTFDQAFSAMVPGHGVVLIRL